MSSRRRSNRGSMVILFAGIILPLSLFLLAVSVDIQGYTTASTAAQRVADEAALLGSRFFPDLNAARASARKLALDVVPGAEVNVLASQNEISVDIRETFSPFFGELLAELTGNNYTLPVIASGKARNNPYDIYIAVDRSSYLAPALSDSGTGAWGDSGSFGAAGLFESTITIPFGTGTFVDPRIATQQCWNPVFRPLKLAALRLLDYFGGFSLNRIAVTFLPGAESSLGRTRYMTAGTSVRSENFFLDTHTDWDSDHYVTVEEPELSGSYPVRSIHCAAAQEVESFFDQYKLPSPPAYLSSEPYPGNLVDVATWNINPDFPLTSRERIWGKSISHGPVMDISVALADLEHAMFANGSLDDRRGLVNRASQLAVLLSAGMPRVGGVKMIDRNDAVAGVIRDSLTRIVGRKKPGSSKLTIFFVSMNDEDISELDELFGEFKKVGPNGEELFEVRAIRPTNSEELISRILAMMALENRNAVVVE